MADTGGHRADRVPAVIPVGIDYGERQAFAHLHDEPAHGEYLLRPQCEFRRGIGADYPVSVEPYVMHAHADQIAQPCLADEIIDVRLAYTCGDPRDQTVAPAILQAGKRLLEDTLAPTPHFARPLFA